MGKRREGGGTKSYAAPLQDYHSARRLEYFFSDLDATVPLPAQFCRGSCKCRQNCHSSVVNSQIRVNNGHPVREHEISKEESSFSETGGASPSRPLSTAFLSFCMAVVDKLASQPLP